MSLQVAVPETPDKTIIQSKLAKSDSPDLIVKLFSEERNCVEERRRKKKSEDEASSKRKKKIDSKNLPMLCGHQTMQ